MAGGGEAILTSPDGILWTRRSLGTNLWPRRTVYDLAFGNHTFVAVGYGETLLTSSDASTWTNFLPAWDFAFNGVAYGNNTFVVVGTYVTLSSRDAASWSRSVWSMEKLWLDGIAYGDNRFVAVGFTNTQSTADGLTWKNHVSPATSALKNIAFGNHTFVAVGEAGTILQSSPLASTDTPPRLTGGLTSGGFELTISGTAGQSYLIQCADDLAGSNAWQTVATLNLTNSPATWPDTLSPHRSQRFYRVLTTP